ncbi:hypothetical protein EDD15DRAFT_2197079 [Pisolithus albus]|nr:hypothetical protein EDD15DRAFT_2197079 [Pisolithus albus]
MLGVFFFLFCFFFVLTSHGQHEEVGPGVAVRLRRDGVVIDCSVGEHHGVEGFLQRDSTFWLKSPASHGVLTPVWPWQAGPLDCSVSHSVKGHTMEVAVADLEVPYRKLRAIKKDSTRTAAYWQSSWYPQRWIICGVWDTLRFETYGTNNQGILRVLAFARSGRSGYFSESGIPDATSSPVLVPVSDEGTRPVLSWIVSVHTPAMGYGGCGDRHSCHERGKGGCEQLTLTQALLHPDSIGTGTKGSGTVEVALAREIWNSPRK